MVYSSKELKAIIDSLPICIQKDLSYHILKDRISEEDLVLYSLYWDKKNLPIIFLCNLKNGHRTDIKNLFIYGFFGTYLQENDFFQMELSIKFNCSGLPIEIVKIISGKEKRTGRGSLGLNFLESFVIPEANSIIKKDLPSASISYIYGISADLSDDTNALNRARFYCQNGFIYSNTHFYKYLNYQNNGLKSS